MTRFSIILGTVGVLVAATAAQVDIRKPARSDSPSRPNVTNYVKPGAGTFHCGAGFIKNDMGGCTWIVPRYSVWYGFL